eukprot:TRINITY_DN70238_c0_g1_i1.p1 TRINITY_DN70238_c0_g1~~TRINITY_DN70238_c0_g1_i1.p1  ORF type:complete len:309 (+),score=44.37 TRINITY_DN70238_c0_g1_i1:210-1136(+)
MTLRLDEWIAQVRACRHLEERDFKTLVYHVGAILAEESNVQIVPAPVVICGDLHGQFHDLLELFVHGGQVSDGTRYIFMGDLVDRGSFSVEVLQYLLLLKARWPDRVTLIRGNHESRQVTRIYGFFDECVRKYANLSCWFLCCDAFDLFATAALVDESVLCVHGGLSPDVAYIDQIRLIDRFCEVPTQGPYCDLLWSDPDDDVDPWGTSPRGAGWLFGPRISSIFARANDLELVCRAHQLVNEGYKYHFGGEVVTVWSAPNYVYRCGNLASILKLDANLGRKFITFSQACEQEEDEASSGSMYAKSFI